MKNITSLPIKYLSHKDYMDVLLFEVHEASEGSYEKHIALFDNNIREHYNVYGYCPFDLHREKRDYIKTWGNAWRNSKYICIDVTTGESYFPCKYKHLEERSIL